MDWKVKQAITRSGLKQKHIAEKMNLTAVNFSKKLIGDLYFTKAEKILLARILHEKVTTLFPKHES